MDVDKESREALLHPDTASQTIAQVHGAARKLALAICKVHANMVISRPGDVRAGSRATSQAGKAEYQAYQEPYHALQLLAERISHLSGKWSV